MAALNEKLYELAYLASSSLDEAGVMALKNDIDARVMKFGGSIREHSLTEKRHLAYPVGKMQNAFFISELITLPATGKQELDKELKFENKIARHLFVATTEKMLKRLRERRISQLQSVLREGTKTPAAMHKPAVVTKAAEKPAEEKRVDIAEIEKKLDEILGREL